jgi:putative spermidine/putrescine transport system permease protein
VSISRRARLLLAAASTVTLLFIYLPILVVIVNSFNPSKVFSWPPRGFSLIWWDKALADVGVRHAVLTSVKAGLGATLIAIVLGAMIAFAVARYSWFGRSHCRELLRVLR